MSFPFKAAFAILLLSLLVVSFFYNDRQKEVIIDDQRDRLGVGLQQVDCWLELEESWPSIDCFRMYVPEDHEQANGRLINFPVMIFRSADQQQTRTLVLHLGGGGPGGAMYLNEPYSVQQLINNHDDISLKQGRDLVVIDPRGAGLAEPLLNCGRFADNEAQRLQTNLTLKEELELQEQDYVACINDSTKKGIDLSAYNSVSVIEDTELLRQALGAEQWVLIGVSYGAVYAQLLANKFPDVVQSMVLDSAAFPDLKLQHEFLSRFLAPYEALYAYCERALFCRDGMADVKTRIWDIVDKLQKNPQEFELAYFANDKEQTMQLALNGHRFISILAYAVYYGEDIYEDLPDIIKAFEADKPRIGLNFRRYAANYIAYMVDRGYADLSMFSHYCYDDKAFVDISLIEQEIQRLPNQLLKDAAMYLVENHEACQLLTQRTPDPLMNSALITDIPTLFLQGALDIVTPPADAQAHLENFSQGHLLTVDYSHSVLQVSPCAEEMAAKFVNDTSVPKSSLVCGR